MLYFVLYSPNIWSQFSATTVRTTNSCESHHSNSRFYGEHPNIFNFVDESLEIQAKTQVNYKAQTKKKKSTLDEEHNPILPSA